MTKARLEKDSRDIQVILNFLKMRNPFEGDTSLRNIVTGVSSNEKVNAHEAKAMGDSIMPQ